MARNYTDLKQQLNIEDFETLAKKVTKAYGNSKIEYTQSEVAKDFDVTTQAVRKLMDYAIINCIVSKDYSVKVLNKLIENQQRKHQEAGGSSIRHHNELMKKRDDVIANSYDEYYILEIVNYWLYEAIDFTDVIHRFNIESERILKLLLQRGIVEDIISDNEANEIIQRSLRKTPQPVTVLNEPSRFSVFSTCMGWVSISCVSTSFFL